MWPSQLIVFASGPIISTPSSSSNETPEEVMLKQNPIDGDIEDFAIFITLCPDLNSSTRRMVTA